MLKTILMLTIMLGLSTLQAVAQEAAMSIQRTLPESVEVSTLRLTKTPHPQINQERVETPDSSPKQEIQNGHINMEEEMAWRENRKRRPLARLVFLAAVVVLIVVLV